ncbi:MAG: hypothetical protein RI884_594 [Pseudomonadota bacterium]
MNRGGAAAGPGAGANERLAQTRLAILEYLQCRQYGAASGASESAEHAQDAGSHWSGMREAGQRYWQGHPARLLVRLASPLLSHWGQRHPVGLVVIAAAAGVLLVLARPWRLISVTGLLIAAVKSPHLASLAMSALASGRAGPRRRSGP